jgi:hypothetical protein
MSSTGDALLGRLRADIELKGQVIKALRAERERDGELVREQTALLAAVGADLLDLATNMALLVDEGNPEAVQRAAERLKVVCSELSDYTAAINGQLVLIRKPLNIGRLLSRIASRHVIDVRVAAPVPERIIADEAQLSKLLTYFVNQGSDSGDAEERLLEVTMAALAPADVSGHGEASGAASTLPRMQFVLHLGAGHGASAAVADRAEDRAPRTNSFDRLRAALARILCGLMDAAHTGTTLTMPVQSAADQAHTGIFRLAFSDLGAAATPLPALGSAAPVAAAMPTGPGALAAAPVGRQHDDSIDLLYLDQQLGSLAPVILARTAPAFIADAQRRMTDLHVAHECEDLTRLEHVARAWKGSALSVGARGLASMLDSIERQAGMGHLPAPGSIWQIRSTLDRVLRALENQHAGSREVT